MLRRAATLALALSFVLGVRASSADACGIKVTVKTPSLKRIARSPSSRQPIRVNDRDAIAKSDDRKPIAAGPARGTAGTAARPPTTEKRPTAVATKEPTPTPTPTPAREPTPTPVATTTPPVEKTPVEKAPVEKTPVEKTPVEKAPVEKAPAPVKVATFKDTEVYFSSNSASISGGTKRSLDKAAAFLAANPNARISVEGHADPSGAPDLNQTLSQSRADGIRDYLVAAGVDSSRIDVAAFGDTKVKYGARDGRNRRVAIKVGK